jgi:hypothetical protein
MSKRERGRERENESERKEARLWKIERNKEGVLLNG